MQAPHAAAPVVASAPVVTPPAPPPPSPVVKGAAMSPEERAAKLGFVKYLPQDTEVVLAFHNGLKSADRITSSKLWKLLQAQVGMGMSVEPDEGMAPGGAPEMKEEDFQLPEGEQDAAASAEADADNPAMPDAGDAGGPAALFGTEFTIALGKSVGEQTANLITASRRMSYFQMRALAKAFAATAKAGDLAALEQAMSDQYGQELVKDLIADPESGVGLIERMKMPPLYLAFRTTAAARPAAAQQLAELVSNLSMLGEMVEPVEVEAGGQKFTGQKLSGAEAVRHAWRPTVRKSTRCWNPRWWTNC